MRADYAKKCADHVKVEAVNRQLLGDLENLQRDFDSKIAELESTAFELKDALTNLKTLREVTRE